MYKFFLLVFCTLFKWEVKSKFNATISLSALTAMYILALIIFLNLTSVYMIITKGLFSNIYVNLNKNFNLFLFLISLSTVTYITYLFFVKKKKYLKLYDDYLKTSFKKSDSKITLIYLFSSFILPFVLALLFKFL